MFGTKDMTIANDALMRIQALYNPMKMPEQQPKPLLNLDKKPLTTSTSSSENFSLETKVNELTTKEVNGNTEKGNLLSLIDVEKLPSKLTMQQQLNLQAYLSELNRSNSYLNSCFSSPDYLSAFHRSVAPSSGVSCNTIFPPDYWPSQSPQADIFSRLNPSFGTQPPIFYSQAWNLSQSNALSKSSD